MNLSHWNNLQRKELRELKRMAAQCGCHLEVDRVGGYATAELTAPSGHCFIDGLHQYVSVCYAPWLPDFQDLNARLSASGVVRCDAPDCDWCTP